MKEEILFEWNPWWSGGFSPEFVDREASVHLRKWLIRREVIALTGPRRSGKTTLMYLTIRELLKTVPGKNILFVKCDDERVEVEGLIEGARDTHSEIFNPQGRVYLFLDEVQEIEGWEKMVKRIYDLNPDIRIFLTGSRLIKEELGISLAGRFLSLEVFPLSFSEFLAYRGVRADTQRGIIAGSGEIRHHLREYIEWGGFPETEGEGESEVWQREEKALLASLKEFNLQEGIIITRKRRKRKRFGKKTIRYVPLYEWLLSG